MKVVELKVIDATFDYFWSSYPRKISKKMAKRAWEKLSTAQQKEAIEGLKGYVLYWERKGIEKEFIPHASTWLNQERWDDELEDETQWDKILG